MKIESSKNEFSKVEWYKVNVIKISIILYSNHKQLKILKKNLLSKIKEN